MIFFALIGINFYTLYNASRQNDMTIGRQLAQNAAHELKYNLVEGMDAVKLLSYAIEEMQAANFTNKQIENFLVMESDIYNKAISGNFTGVYAYCNGEYLDGVGWVPEEGYEPTERPWYTAAIAAKGKVALVSPYLDALTNTVMISISQMLSDGKSVVSLDIEMDGIQKKILELGKGENFGDVLLLDSQGFVIAHSDKKEIGKIYQPEEDSPGGSLIRNLRASTQDNFEFSFDKKDCIAFYQKVNDEWYALAILDKKVLLSSLKYIYILTLVIIFVFVFAIVLMLLQTNEKRLQQERLHSQIRAVADIFISMHEIDFLEDSFTEITCRNDIREAIGTTTKDAQKRIREVMSKIASEQTRDRILEFVDLSTLGERLKNKHTIVQEFQSILGKQFWSRARFIVIDRREDGSPHHLIWAVESINEEKLERDRLQKIAEASEAASRAKSAFLANMSHEIRTPINAMLGMNEMILRESKDKNLQHYAMNVKNAGNTLLSIVNDILDFSKIEAGKMSIIPEPYNLSLLLADLIQIGTERTKEKNLAFMLNISEDIPKILVGDNVRIKQCILNLLENAVKYTHQGGITLTVSAIPDGEKAILLNIIVHDSGIGIKPEDMEKLFSPFDRIEENRNRTIEGTGLGLSIVQRLLTMMGSQLFAKSEYGKGSEFSFTIRQEIVSSEPIGDIMSINTPSAVIKPYREKLHAPQATILFVDDTAMNLAVVQGLLKHTGIFVDTATSGFSALQKISKTSYDILFIDHRMPGMDGIETLHTMREMPENKSFGKPCIALTANAISGAREMYLEAGFNDYLAKPVNPDALEAMIRKYLPPELIENSAGAKNFDSPEEQHIDIPDFPPVEGIDIQQGLSYCGGATLLKDMLSQYREKIPQNIEEIASSLASKDITNYRIKVHSLKSTSRLIGAMEVTEKAAYLETCADNQDITELRNKTPELLELYQSYLYKLEHFSQHDTKTEENPLIPANVLKEKMDALLIHAEKYDIDSEEAIIAQLREYRMPEQFMPVFEKICRCIQNIDFAGLLALQTDIQKIVKEA